MIFRIVFLKKKYKLYKPNIGTRIQLRNSSKRRVFIHNHATFSQDASQILDTHCRLYLFIKVHNLQADRQSLEIQPGKHAKSSLHICRTCRRKAGRTSEICSLIPPDYPNISGSHCSLNSRAYPIYHALEIKTVIFENNFHLFIEAREFS